MFPCLKQIFTTATANANIIRFRATPLAFQVTLPINPAALAEADIFSVKVCRATNTLSVVGKRPQAIDDRIWTGLGNDNGWKLR